MYALLVVALWMMSPSVRVAEEKRWTHQAGVATPWKNAINLDACAGGEGSVESSSEQFRRDPRAERRNS